MKLFSKRSLLISSFLCFTTAHADPNLGAFEHDISGTHYKFVLSGDLKERLVTEVQVFCGSSTTPCQVLPNDGDPIREGEVENFIFNDFNFDGNDDIAMVSSYGASGNAYYNIWLFEPNTSKFVANEELSALGAPKPDPKTKIISTSAKGGAAGCERDEGYYTFEEDKLTLISQREYLFDEEQCKFIMVERVRKDDVIQETLRKINHDCEDMIQYMTCGK